MTLGAQRATSTMLTRESPVVGVVFSSTKKRPSHKRRVRFGIKTETIPEASNEIDVDNGILVIIKTPENQNSETSVEFRLIVNNTLNRCEQSRDARRCSFGARSG